MAPTDAGDFSCMEGMVMKALLRRMCCFGLCALMLLSVAGPGLAATYDVGTAEQLSNSWAEANAGADLNNTFTMTQNIDMAGWGLDAMDNRSYTITSKGDGDYTISNVFIYEAEGTYSGDDPKVAIQADISDNNNSSRDALCVIGDVSVVVDGDITTKADGGDQTFAVMANQDASIIVMGDITAKDAGVLSLGGSDITVYGDVEINGSKYDPTFVDYAVAADDKASIIVHGDVDSTKGGANVTDGSGIRVNGDLTADKAGLHVVEGSAIWVEGDVEAPGDSWVYNWSTVTVEGDMEMGDYVTVEKRAKIDVEGSFEATGQINIKDHSTLSVNNGLTVNEDPTLPDNMPSGVFTGGSSFLEVYGDTVTPVLATFDKSKTELDSVYSDEITVGTQNSSDTSRLMVAGGVDGLGSEPAQLYAAGDSYTQVIQYVKGQITAVESAEVEVWGSVDYLPKVYDDAKVTTNLATKPKNFYENTGNYEKDNLVKLCKEYTVNSAMEEHMTTLRDIMISASVDLTDRMNLGNAFVISLFQGDDIAMDLIPNFDYDTLEDAGYNAASTKNLENADSVNAYMVKMYKTAIAKSLRAVADTPYGEIVTDDAKDCNKFSSNIYGFITGLPHALNKNQSEFLKSALENEIFSEDEAREFLIKFGGFKKGQKGIGSAAQELVAAYEMSKALKGLNKAGKVIMTVGEFKEFFSNSYTNQVKVLDNMLMNQEMSPEMFVAVAQLRNEYENQLMGALGIGKDVAKDMVMDKVKDCVGNKVPLFAITDAAMDIAEALGAIDKQDAIHKSAPIICYLPSAMDAYEAAVLRVKNGDTSEEALELVSMNYVFVRESIKALCDYMAVAGNSQQQKEYKDLAAKLENLEIGHAFGEPEGVLTAENFDEFYKNNIDPNVKYVYA